MWGDDGNDVYVVDPNTGTAQARQAEDLRPGTLSDDGKYVIFFDNGQWYTYAMATGKTVDITTP
jgi:hypothetical protein